MQFVEDRGLRSEIDGCADRRLMGFFSVVRYAMIRP